MPSTFDACQKFFGSTDLYAIFDIDKKASVAEGEYFKTSLNTDY